MAHTHKNFDHLLGECKAFLSEKQLQAHFTLYQGYVKKLNEIEERLAKADPTTANYYFSEYSELRRREPVAYNGTILHELYFANLGQPEATPSAGLKQAVETSFGTWDAFIADIKGIVGSGHGWCLVTFDYNFMKVRTNMVQGEHHVGLLPEQQVLLAIDAWEHAYFLDYGTKKPDYLAGVLKHINWDKVGQRFAPAAQHLSSSKQS
jgi:Fe-Mn family superoxide dismutase